MSDKVVNYSIQAIRESITLMRRRLESRQGTRAGAMCRLSLSMSEDLLQYHDDAKRERDEYQGKYEFMVCRAADQKLDGYRELGSRAAAAENELFRLRANIKRIVADWETAFDSDPNSSGHGVLRDLERLLDEGKEGNT